MPDNCYGCPLLRHSITYVPYGDAHAELKEPYCAVDQEPISCDMHEDEEGED